MNKIFIPAFIASFIYSGSVYKIGYCEDDVVACETDQNENNAINVVLEKTNSEISDITVTINQKLEFKSRNNFDYRNEDKVDGYHTISSSSSQSTYSFKDISELGDICRNFAKDIESVAKQLGNANITIRIRSNLPHDQILSIIKHCCGGNICLKMIDNSHISITPSKQCNNRDYNNIMPLSKLFGSKNSTDTIADDSEKNDGKCNIEKLLKEVWKHAKNKVKEDKRYKKRLEKQRRKFCNDEEINLGIDSSIQANNYKALDKTPRIDLPENKKFVTDQSSVSRTERIVNIPILPNVKMTWKHIRSSSNENLSLYARLLEIILRNSISGNINCNYDDSNCDFKISIESRSASAHELEAVLIRSIKSLADGISERTFYALQELLLEDQNSLFFHNKFTRQSRFSINGISYAGFNSFLKIFETTPNTIYLTWHK